METQIKIQAVTEMQLPLDTQMGIEMMQVGPTNDKDVYHGFCFGFSGRLSGLRCACPAGRLLPNDLWFKKLFLPLEACRLPPT